MKKIAGIVLIGITTVLSTSCSGGYNQLLCEREDGTTEKMLYDDETFLYFQMYNSKYVESDSGTQGSGYFYPKFYEGDLDTMLELYEDIDGLMDHFKEINEEYGYSCEIKSASRGFVKDYKDFRELAPEHYTNY